MDCNVLRRTISETGINSVIESAVHDVESAIRESADINLEQYVKISNSLMLSLATTDILKHIDSGALQDVREIFATLFLGGSNEYALVSGLSDMGIASEEQTDFVKKFKDSAWSFADIVIAKVKNFTSIGGGSILSSTLDDAKVLVFSDANGNVDRKAVLKTLEQVKQIVLH